MLTCKTRGAWHADRFVVVTHALEERRTPGNTLIVQPDQPWQVSAPPANTEPCHGTVLTRG